MDLRGPAACEVTESYFSLRMKVPTFAIVGPESSGKSTLTEALAHHYRCVWVKEYARAVLEEQGPDYVEEDLLAFARGQLVALGEGIQMAQRTGPPLVFCDTDIITIRIWSEEVYGRCHPLIKQLANNVAFDHWFLCRPDMPWEPDPLRENPQDRDRLFTVYEDMLKRLKKPYTIIEGDHGARMRTATAIVDGLAEIGGKNMRRK